MTDQQIEETLAWLASEPDKAELGDRACREWPDALKALREERKRVASLTADRSQLTAKLLKHMSEADKDEIVADMSRKLVGRACLGPGLV